MTEGLPWFVGGDFNIFGSNEERQSSSGQGRNRQREMLDFVDTINDCQLIDPGNDGAKFTWAHGELFERLYRILISEGWPETFPSTRITALPRAQSDHGPLLIRCKETISPTFPPFRFQNMWTRHHTFGDTIKDLWREETGARRMRNLQLKLKRIKLGLKTWNKEVFGNIFLRRQQAEDEAATAQKEYENNPSLERRERQNRDMAQYILCLRMEEDYLKQKAAIRWIVEGERNTKYYQGWVRQKRVKSRIHEIKDGDSLISSDEGLRDSAANFFHNLLSSDLEALGDPDLDLIQPLPEELNVDSLGEAPKEEEVKEAMFGIAADSTPGPDGFSALFFQHC